MMEKTKKDIKLIALDMDGTLLNNEGEISEGNRKAIAKAQEKGIYVVLSTGRSITTCRHFAKSLKLTSYIITVNGSEIWDSNDQLIERNTLSSNHIETMHSLTNTHNTHFWAVTTDKVWRGEFPENITDHEWLKYGFDVQDDEIRKVILDELTRNPELEVSNSSPTNIEVNAVGINKAKALETISEKLGITLDNVMAMGDSLNDLAMIKAAGVGVAMGNAQDLVKEEANWVTATNVEDGVAKAIEHWAL